MHITLASLRWLRSHSAQGLITALYALAIGVAYRAGPGRTRWWCIAALGLVGLLAWGAALRRARAIANVATSRIAHAAQGYVELQGRTSIHSVQYSPISGTPCIWYRYRTYERHAGHHALRPDLSGAALLTDWLLVDSGSSSATFDLIDASGRCTIDPDHAEVMGAEVITRYDIDTQHVEELLRGGRTLYALGDFTTVSAAGTAQNLREDVNALLTQWKQDAPTLHRRFDLNRDGQIDQREWELARRLATRTVEKEHGNMRTHTGVHVLRAPRDGRLFLLSPLPPHTLRQRYLLWATLHLCIALGAAAAAGATVGLWASMPLR